MGYTIRDQVSDILEAAGSTLPEHVIDEIIRAASERAHGVASDWIYEAHEDWEIRHDDRVDYVRGVKAGLTAAARLVKEGP